MFRPPAENSRLSHQLVAVASQPPGRLRRFLASQQEAISQARNHWSYRVYWSARRMARFPGLRSIHVPAPIAKAWSMVTGKLRRRMTNWLVSRGSKWLSKQLVKTGIKKFAKAALVKLASLLGIGGGPPGWLVTAAIWLKGLSGRGLRWLSGKFFGRGGLGNFIASGFGIISLPEGESYDFKKMLLFGILGSVVILFILVIVVIMAVAGAIFTSSGRGGSQNTAYFNDLYRNRVDCQVEGQSPIARQACQIENALRQCQGGQAAPLVRSSNIGEVVGCLRNAAVPADVVDAIRGGIVDGNLQCVGFAKAAAAWLRTFNGNAKDFASHFRHKSWNQLQPGDAVVNVSGQYGHIAIVTKVFHPEVGEVIIQISQADGYLGTVFTSRLPLSYLRQGSWRVLKRP